jgi:hypothetical protein
LGLPDDGLLDYHFQAMRTWLLAVSALTLVALTSPIAGEKRTSALAVRVNVVRSCSVSTGSALQSGGTVTCGTRFGPPVMSSNTTISMPVPVAPAAAVGTTTAGAHTFSRDQPDQHQSTQQGDGREAQPAQSPEVSTQRITETMTTPAPGNAAAGPGGTVTIRVMTVNF